MLDPDNLMWIVNTTLAYEAKLDRQIHKVALVLVIFRKASFITPQLCATTLEAQDMWVVPNCRKLLTYQTPPARFVCETRKQQT